MCGIAGIVDFSDAMIDDRIVEEMTASLMHRGPDGAGYFRDANAVFGHRRLSIIDIAGGAQPIANEDETVQVVFNGEIYNFVELRKELVSLGHVFSTRSDTEVIVHSYEQWGVECTRRFNGIFAFALFDSRNQSVLLARDHLGVKPLYYTRVGSQFVFASEIKALLEHPGFNRSLDTSALADLFTFRYVPSPRTLMSGVRKLPPGCWLKVGITGESTDRYWRRIPSHRIQRDERELILEYQDLLEETVDLQLRSDVPLGLFLSSGVDSSALLALMSRKSSRPVETFTIDFEDGELTNESAQAARIARRFGAHHHTMTVTAADYASYFERYMTDIEEPVGHESAPAFYFVSQLAKNYVKVALSGQGADEPWAGYNRYIGVKLSTTYSRLPVWLTQSAAAISQKLPMRSERLRRGLVSLGERDLLQRFVSIYSFFSEAMKDELYQDSLKTEFAKSSHSPADSIRHLQHEVSDLDALSQILYIDVRTNLPDDLLMVGDKTSMANSIELRVPFLDCRVVEFIEGLPPFLKLSGLTGKYLHKKAMLKWLPHEDVYRRKIGFSNPIDKWFRSSMQSLINDSLLSSESRIKQYFNQEYIEQIVRQDRDNRGNFTREIYLLLSLELWHRAFID